MTMNSWVPVTCLRAFPSPAERDHGHEILSTCSVQRLTTSMAHIASINPATKRATVISAAVTR